MSCKFQHYDLSASQVGPHTLKENIHNIIYIYTHCFLWPRVLNKLSESSIWWVLIRTFGGCCGVFLLHSDSCELIRDVHDDQRMQRYTNAARGARKHRVGRTTGTRRLINLHRWILLNAHHRPNLTNASLVPRPRPKLTPTIDIKLVMQIITQLCLGLGYGHPYARRKQNKNNGAFHRQKGGGG